MATLPSGRESVVVIDSITEIPLTVNSDGSINTSGGSGTGNVNLTQVAGTNVVTGGVSGLLGVAGNAAAAATDAGNPVKIGGKFNTTPPGLSDGQRGDAQSDSRGNMRVLPVLLNLAATDGFSNSNTGYPLSQISNASGGAMLPPNGNMLLNGTSWDRQRSIQGVTANTGVGVTAIEAGGSPYANITTSTTTTVKSGAGILHKIIVNNPGTTATITIYDSTTGSGTKIGTIGALAATQETLSYDLFFGTGLTIVTTGAPDLTVVYR